MVTQINSDTKQCRSCGNFKAVSTDYYKNKAQEDGLHADCKQCCKVTRALENVRKRDKSSKISVRQIYRARQLGIEYDPKVKLVEVYKRSRGICGVCKKWVKPKHASMDHALALINGGTHTYNNLQITHLVCNLRKGAR